MNLTQDLDIWTLIVNASVVVKVVMAILLVVSFMSWMFIFQKWFSIRRAISQTEKFEREFWSGNDLLALYQGAVNHRHSIGSLERIFEAGFREFAKQRGQKGTDTSDMVDSARRAMRATFQREMDYLERHLAFLASTGDTVVALGDAHGFSADELRLLDRIDRVADDAVDIVGRQPGVGERGQDRLGRELGLAPAGRLRELRLPDPDDRRSPTTVGAHHRSSRRRKTGTAMSATVGSNATSTSSPMRTSAGSTSTRFDRTRTPSSRSTRTATTGYVNAGCCG